MIYKKGKTVFNVVKLFIITGVLLGAYSFSSVVTELIWSFSQEPLDRSMQGMEFADVSPDDLIRSELSMDFSSMMDALLDSDLLDSMTDEEKLDFFEDMFGDGIEDFIEEQELSPDEFLSEYGEDLADLMESVGGQEFDSDIFRYHKRNYRWESC